MDKEKVLHDMLKKEPSLSRLIKGEIRVNLDQDYIIPESVYDTAEVLLTSPRVDLKNVITDNGSVTVEGEVIYDVLLHCEDGTLSGVTYSDTISASYYDSAITNKATAAFSDCSKECSARLINPRKINLSSELVIPITVIVNESASTEVIGTESIDDEMTLQRKSRSFDVVSAIKHEENDVPVSLDIELDGNNPPISRILYRHLELSAIEIKPKGNNLDARLSAMLCIIYLSEEGNRFTFNKSIALEKSFSVANADDYSWSVSTCYRDLTVEPAQNGYGEMKLLELDFNYSIFAFGIKNDSTNVCCDFYSTQYECESTLLSSEVTSLKRAYSSALSVNASSSYDDAGVSDVRTVIASGVTVSSPSITFVKDKKKLIFDAVAEIKCACENVYVSEDEKKYSSALFKYPIKCEIDANDETEGSDYVSNVTVYGIRSRADGSRLFCDLELGIKINAYESAEAVHVSSVHLDKAAPVSVPTSAITLCYPGRSESLWDIAKYYRVSVDSIIAANSLESEDISEKKVLLIPTRKLQNASIK